MDDRMGLRSLLIKHHEKYPEMQIVDVLKLLYQSEFGCGHMISDGAHSYDRIFEEAASLPVKALEGDAVEPIGDGLVRLYLRILNQDKLSYDTLNRLFMLTANQPRGSIEGFKKKTLILEKLCKDRILPYDMLELSRICKDHLDSGYPIIRHSQVYRSAYAPSYRVVEKRFCDVLPLLCKIDDMMQSKSQVVVAIDGNSAAGKSTLAALLKSVYDCNVFSMDDFFLRPYQRTPERLMEPGGNVDYERFKQEVLEPLINVTPFTYEPYDCSTQELAEEKRVEPHSLNIIEGVYSMHPYLLEAYDLKVFLSIETDEQRRRLLKRNKELYSRFVQEWIPLENKYFDTYQIQSQCDMVYRL